MNERGVNDPCLGLRQGLSVGMGRVGWKGEGGGILVVDIVRIGLGISPTVPLMWRSRTSEKLSRIDC